MQPKDSTYMFSFVTTNAAKFVFSAQLQGALVFTMWPASCVLLRRFVMAQI